MEESEKEKREANEFVLSINKREPDAYDIIFQ